MRNSIRKAISVCLFTGMMASSALAAQDAPQPDNAAWFGVTYRDNSVLMESAKDIEILSGNFRIDELKITEGQDPEGKNQVGQLHELTDHSFTFTCGRQGSQEVAQWFNQKFSGYNDPAVTGDRTTFDQTADELNFAFVGDLQLTVKAPAFPEGCSVTFEDVAFAQGSTAFRNNWWFGQLKGQHTRDADGPNRMLAIGADEAGNTVFASFLRGGNDVNAVSLEAIAPAHPANDHAVTLPNVQQAFHALPDTGTRSELKGFGGNYDPSVNHIQGYAQYLAEDGTNYALLTHSVSTAPYAHILVGQKNGEEMWGFKTYLQNWQHPGGVQSIGDYLLVPSEHDNQAHIALYDMRTLSVQELRRVETFDLTVDHKAGALGITSYKDAGGTEYYLLLVAHLDGENSVYHAYRAPAANGLEQAVFQKVGSFPLNKDFQGFGLITEAETGKVYMIGLWSPSEGATFADYAYLYELNTQNWTIGDALEERHLTSQGGFPGIMGVHFRYGAGVLVTPDQNLMLYASERNTVLGSVLAINDWRSGQ